MYSGIVAGLFEVVFVEELVGLTRYGVQLESVLTKRLEVGASVAIDGVCQTVVGIEEEDEGDVVYFDVIEETLSKTTLCDLKVGRLVNVERSLRFGDEIGGHLIAGHVFGVARVLSVVNTENNREVQLGCPSDWMKYILPKGFVALDGVSLTVGEVCQAEGRFSVHLIPETLRLTTFGWKKEGDGVNLELDAQTQAIVATTERVLEARMR